MAVCPVAPARALDPERAMSQYLRDRWTVDTGFPGGSVYAITQSADGYLWIAAEKGLVRFDGLRFELIRPIDSTSASDSTIIAMAPHATDGLWAHLRRGSFVRYRNGAFDHVLMRSPERLTSIVTAMGVGVGRAMLVADLNHGVMAVGDGQIDTLVPARAMPRSLVIAMTQTSDGDVWLGTRDSGVLRVHGGQVASIAARLPDQKVNCLLADVHGQLWIGTDNGLVHWDPKSGHQVDVAALRGGRVVALLEDRDANLWVAHSSTALARVNNRGVTLIDGDAVMSNDGITSLFEDRDGNVWVGTETGIERWRDGAFTTYRTKPGGAFTGAGPVLVDGDRVWFAPASGGLYSLHDGPATRVSTDGLTSDVIYSIGGGDEELWIGSQRGGLLRVRVRGEPESVHRFTTRDGLAQNNVYAVHRSRDGAVWAGTLSGGVSRFKEGAFATYTTADGLASNTVASILERADGTMWFATSNGVSARTVKGWRNYSIRDGLPSEIVNTLFEDSAHNLWIGTAGGLALLRGDRIDALLHSPSQLRASILGIAEDAQRKLWIVTTGRVLRLDRDALAGGVLREEEVRVFGTTDGLPGVDGIKRHRSLVADGRGRIWISLARSLSMADPARMMRAAPPALVHVESVDVDGRATAPHSTLTIPPQRRRLAFSYTGLSLAVPERVMFRYRLDGFDREWSAATPARRAEYTNLSAGAYRFRVTASNSDGVWNASEAAIAFVIEPAFWQTTMFRILIALLVAASVWMVYRVRVVRVTRALNVRFEERLAERTRIARELHDTLLQSFHGLLFRFQAVSNILPDRPSEAKQKLESAIDHAAQAITEGRDAVQKLRASTDVANDLAVAIGTLGEELAATHVDDPARKSPIVDLTIEGTPRNLHPIARDDVYRIAGEALRNAFRHASAHRVEVHLRYDDEQLQVRIRDDGNGIDAAVLDEQPSGHFGLPGMRERAELIGGRLEVWSERGVGTEVDLRIPAGTAYAMPRERGRSRFFGARTGTNV